MGDWCSSGLECKFDTAIYAKLEEDEIDDEVDNLYYHVHSSDKHNHSVKIEEMLDGKFKTKLTELASFY